MVRGGVARSAKGLCGCVLSTVPVDVEATRTVASPEGWIPAGTVVLRSCDLRVRGGGTVMAAGAVPLAGELTVFCRPVGTAPAGVRRDGTGLAGGWLSDLVRLGGMGTHPGGRGFRAVCEAAVEEGR